MTPKLVASFDKNSREAIKERIYSRRYLLPNAVTVANLFCGFLAIIYASSGRFDKASLAIMLAILLDGLDGRVARKLNATSKFGVEFDSFSDLISFGVAPAILVYNWCFLPQARADEFGVFVGFVFVVCSASRLARFNIDDTDLKGFTGLPTPGSAGLIAALVNFAPAIDSNYLLVAAMTGIMLSLAYMMVSKIPFLSIKTFKLNAISVTHRILLAMLIALLWYNGRVGFLVIASCYVLSGFYADLKRLLSSH